LFGSDEAADTLVINDGSRRAASFRDALSWLTCLLESISCVDNAVRLSSVNRLQQFLGKNW